ncbi:MAG: septal ring lytic transglycosylase RlpA family protein [Polaromonas sp.]|nr:septal ring lytic transglycosylase RlpA family protein [Polaromonas sp.]
MPPVSDVAPAPGAPTSSAAPRAPAEPQAPQGPAPATLPDNTPLLAVPQAEANLLAGEIPREFEQGKASWYGPRFNGRRTASGERYNMHEMTAAHKTLPFGTMVRVRSLVNGKEVEVRITDRGPFSRGRVIDLSRAAAEAIGMMGLGVKDVLLLVPESTPSVTRISPAPSVRMRQPVTRSTPRPR